MAVRKIRKSWWVDFRFEHTRYRRRSPENSRAGALAYEASLKSRLIRGEDLNLASKPHPQETRFSTFAEEWYANYVVANSKATGQKAKKYILSSSLVPFFGRMTIGAISEAHIERYKAHERRRGVSNKTINNELAVLRTCLSAAYEWLGIERTPPRLKPLKLAPSKTDHLTAAEAHALIDHSEGVVHELVILALHTGMRQGEIRGLQWEDVDWETRTLAVRHSQCDLTRGLTSPKNNRERFVPMSEAIFKMLADRRQASGYVFRSHNGHPLSGKIVLRYLHRAQHRAGLRSFGWHVLRHTFASQLTVNGVPIRVVQELLGHSTITMTMRYSHVAPGDLRDAIQALETTPSENMGNPWATARAQREYMR